jgi:large subunit ribosomal protein L20
MPRVKGGSTTRARHKKVLKEARGYRGGRSKLYKTAHETLDRAMAFAYEGRKLKKRDFRRLWQVRINAAVREHGLSYSKFIAGLKKSGVELDRKILAELAIAHPADFGAVVEIAKNSIAV